MTPNQALQAAKEALDKALSEKKQNQELIKSLGPAIIEAITPVIQELTANAKLTKKELMEAVSSIKIEVPEIKSPLVPDIKVPQINVPEPKVTVNFDTSKIKLPEIKIPVIRVPKPEVTVNVPDIKIPDLMWPKEEMPIKGDVRLLGIDTSHPLPVQLRDAKGNPIDFSKMGGAMAVFGGGNSPNVNIMGATGTVGVVTINPDGSPTYSVSAGSANSVYLTNADNIYYNSDNPLPVTFSGGSGDGTIMDAPNSTRVSVRALTNSNALVTEIVDGSGNQITSFGGGTQYSEGQLPSPATGTVALGEDNGGQLFALRTGSGVGDTTVLRVQIATDSVASVSVTNLFQAVGDTGGGEGVANALRIVQASGSVSSMAITGINGPVGQGDSSAALRVIMAGDVAGSVVTMINTSTGGDSAAQIQFMGGFGGAAGAANYAYNGSSWDRMRNTAGEGNALRVQQANDAVSSVVINSGTITTVTTLTGITNSVAAALVDSGGVQYSGSNPLPTTASLSVPQGPGDGATALRVLQAGNTIDSVNIQQVGGTAVDTNTGASSAGSMRVILANNSILSTQTTTDAVANSDYPAGQAMMYGINGTNGTWDRARLATLGGGYQDQALRVTHATDAIASVNLVTDSVHPVGQGDLATALRIVQAGDSIASIAITGINGPVGQGDAASALRIVVAGNSDMSVSVSGSVTSTVVVGDIPAGTADTGSAPVKVGGIARQTNPTAEADGDRLSFTSDDLGRQVFRPVQVRDLIATAYVSLSTGTEATLLAATAGEFHDLIAVSFANNSTAAVQVDLRAVTAGNIVYSAVLQANGPPSVWQPPVPWPQDATGNNWTVDMPDITGTTVFVSALFSKEV